MAGRYVESGDGYDWIEDPAPTAIDYSNPNWMENLPIQVSAPDFGGGASIPLTAENVTQMTEYNDPSIKAARDKAAQDALAAQILGTTDAKLWTGQGFGSAQQNAADMARVMAQYGITDIGQFGVQDKVIPGGTVTTAGEGEDFTNYVPDRTVKEYINKTTGQVINPSYDRATGNIWSGTFAGQGSTGYGVQFDEKDNPYFYTQFGGSTNDLANLLNDPLINFVANAAAAATGGPLAVAALNGANAIANGSSVEDAILTAGKAAALAYAGQAASQGATSGLTETLGATGAKVVGNAAGQVVSSGGKVDPVQALITGGLSAGTNAVLGNVTGFENLSSSAQKAISNAVAQTLQTGSIDPKSAMKAALETAMTMANEEQVISPYFATGAGTGDLPDFSETPATKFTNIMPEDFGTTVEEDAATDWAAVHATPTTDPDSGETSVGRDVPEYGVQDMNVTPENWDSYVRSLQNIVDDKGGFTSQWQVAGSDRILVNDDGTGIGINENGDTYALSDVEVKKMIDAGVLNTEASGYVAATGGTKATTKTTPKTTTKTTTPATPAKKETATSTPTSLYGETPSIGRGANIKSFKELFGKELFQEEQGSPGDSSSGEQQFYGGGNVQDFDVDALLQILRS